MDLSTKRSVVVLGSNSPNPITAHKPKKGSKFTFVPKFSKALSIFGSLRTQEMWAN